MEHNFEKIYSKKVGKKVALSFLRPNFVDDYNNDINSVDRADQLRTSYNVGYGLTQRKWWRSIFLLGFDVSIVNSYLLYKSWYEMHGLKPMSHYHFWEKIALAWLDEDQFGPTTYSRRSRSTTGTRRNTSSTESLKSSSLSSARVTRSVATSNTISTSITTKSCKTLN